MSNVKILISGSSGLVGSAAVAALSRAGHEVLRWVRRPAAGPDERSWDPAAGRLDPTVLAGVDAVIHLAGENIGAGRWTPAFRQRLRASRIDSTRLIAQALAAEAGRREQPPFLLVASAVGYYGDRGAAELDESSSGGEGFLAELCHDWEAAADPARAAGVRVVHWRLGVVLSRRGGALAKMLPPFRLGLGGPLGDGRQYLSWIHEDDAIASLLFLLEHPLAGPVNAVAPAPSTQADFSRALGAALGRPSWLPVPRFAIRLGLGQMGEELLLASTRVLPRRLLDAGFQFAYTELDQALRAVTGK